MPIASDLFRTITVIKYMPIYVISLKCNIPIMLFMEKKNLSFLIR